MPTLWLTNVFPRCRVLKENCLICLDDKTSAEMATVKKCRHKFCVACMQKHAEVQVQVNQVPVRCPQVLFTYYPLCLLFQFIAYRGSFSSL